MKHIILVHGRSTKPTRSEKLRLVRRALVSGLERVDLRAARAVRDQRVKLTLAYFGDVSNAIAIENDPEVRERMRNVRGAWYEHSGIYDEDLDELIARPTERHSKREYRRLLERLDDVALLDDALRVVSPLASLLGLGDRVVRSTMPDLAAYFSSRSVGSAIRQRLQKPLKKALSANEDVALVAHSMGCIVAYDVLWKLSRMSEHARVRDRQVDLWLTLGSPLGDAFTKDHLYDSNEPPDGRYPTNINNWLNMTAYDDFVAYDGSIRDDFKKMRSLVNKIEDAPRFYSFWSRGGQSNPHKLYGYLNHPRVARRLADWIHA